MFVLMIIGLIVCGTGKLKLAPTITLEGVRARWYGLFLFATASPFFWCMRHFYVLVLPSQVLNDGVWRAVISIVSVIGYVVLLAFPFRVRNT